MKRKSKEKESGICYNYSSMSEAEQQPRIETELQNDVTPTVARFLAGKDFFSVKPHQLSVSQENELFQMLATQTENDLERGLIDDLAGKSRAEHWKKEAMKDEKLYHFANRNERFNQQVEQEFLATLDKQQLEDKDSDLAKTLTAIGLNPDMLGSRKAYIFTKDGKVLDATTSDETAKTVELIEGIESFRQKYFDDDSTSKAATEFIIDIAETCKKEDGSVDIAKLRTQLHSVGKLLGVFGKKEDHIDILMEDFSIAYGLASQKEDNTKKALARETVHQLRKPITDEEERAAYLKLPQEQNYVGFQLRRAQEEALTPNLIEEVKEQQDVINKKFQDGEITDIQRKEELDDIPNSNKGIIETHSIEELKALFTELEKRGINKETLQHTLKHEQTHFDKVVEIGEILGKDLSPRIIVQLGKGADGKFTYQPRTVWNFNEVPDLDDVTRREINEDIIAAAGDDLSKSDENVLGLGLTEQDIQEMRTLLESEGTLPEGFDLSSTELRKLAKMKKQQRLGLKQRYRKYKGTILPTTIEEIPHGEYENPSRIIEPSLVTSGNALKALGVYDKDLHSQEALGLALQADETDSTGSAKFINVLQKQTSENNITITHPPTLNDALKAIEEGDAAIIFLQDGQATIEPGQKVYQNAEGELFIQVISPEGETKGLPLDVIIDNSFRIAIDETRAVTAIEPPFLLFKKKKEAAQE